jgi:hypothetical protein
MNEHEYRRNLEKIVKGKLKPGQLARMIAGPQPAPAQPMFNRHMRRAMSKRGVTKND